MAKITRTLKKRLGARKPTAGASKLVLAPAEADDIIFLLKAWRYWLAAGLFGALIGAAAFALVPPSYRARATVGVDFHLEQAWPQNTDREQFYYLERETRKLIEIAMSDKVLESVDDVVPGTSVEALRTDMLRLSQPGSGGWHFYAQTADPDVARRLATTWAKTFATEVELRLASGAASDLEEYITVDLSQVQHAVVERSLNQGWYILGGAALALALAALAVLFLPRP